MTGTYAVESLLTLAQSGLGGDATGTVVTIGGSLVKTAGDLPFSDWFASGASVTYAFSDPVASTVPGKRYALTTPAATPASGFLVSGAVTITGTYKTQFEVTFAQSGIGGDSTGTVVTIGVAPTAAQLPFDEWFDHGSAVSYLFGDPVASSVPGKRYALTTPAPTPASPVTVSGPTTITGTTRPSSRLRSARPGSRRRPRGLTRSWPFRVPTRRLRRIPFANWYSRIRRLRTPSTLRFRQSPSALERSELTNGGSLPPSPITVTAPLTVNGSYTLYTYTIQLLKPIDQSTGSSYIVNTGKNGRVIPVKVEVFKNGTEVDAGTFLMKVVGRPAPEMHRRTW